LRFGRNFALLGQIVYHATSYNGDIERRAGFYLTLYDIGRVVTERHLVAGAVKTEGPSSLNTSKAACVLRILISLAFAVMPRDSSIVSAVCATKASGLNPIALSQRAARAFPTASLRAKSIPFTRRAIVAGRENHHGVRLREVV
jgi:hypothetical protein